MELTFLGLGGALNTNLGNNMAFYKSNTQVLLIDCGESCLKQLISINALDNVTEFYIAITHNHADHIAGLANIIWYLNLVKNIQPIIIQNTPAHQKDLTQILTLVGVKQEFYKFIPYNQFNMNGLTIKPVKTKHEPTLECFGFLLNDNGEKSYYSGDTYDVEQIKNYINNPEIKTVYTEVCDLKNSPHIYIEELLNIVNIDKSKIRLMHFTGSLDLHIKVQKLGFKLPKNIIIK